MNRIDQKFKQLKKEKRAAFIAYVTAGYPNLSTTEKLVPALAAAGADIIELGVPFSDPLADGKTIQDASYQALQKGVTLTKILAAVKRIRKRSQVPVALMTYYNPVFHFGEDRFVKQATACGVDGVIIPDLPPEEAKGLIVSSRRVDLSTIFFLSPTTTPDRARRVVQAATGFVYFVSVAGVTGARQDLPAGLINRVRQAKSYTAKPVCVGFGISTADQVKKLAKVCDGVIVGSAIIREISKSTGRTTDIQRVATYVRSLTRALK